MMATVITVPRDSSL